MIKEIIGDATLYLGDAREMPEGKADLVVTDAPYLLESGGNTTGEMGGKFAIGIYDNSGKIVECDITWPEIWSVIKNGLALSDRAHIYAMSNNRNINECWNAALAEGFHFHNILQWRKGAATPNRWYMKNTEYTLMFKKGAAFPINDCGQSQEIKCLPTKETEHPTEKPVELMANYIRQSSQPNQTVYDPFMGAGATIVAAIREGRKAIGCEIKPEHFETACKRVEAQYANRQEVMFA